MKEYLELFLIFVKVGGFTFGGGYAMLPIITRELADNRHWVTDSELADYFAIGQCTPGIIAINVATFVGIKRKGFIGGIVATLGVVFAPLILITLIAAFLSNFASYPIVAHAFAGIRVCVCVLIVNAILRLWSKSVVDKKTLVMCAAVFLLSVFTNVSLPVLVIVSALVGIVLQQSWKKTANTGKGGTQ